MYLQIIAIFYLAIVHSSLCNDDVHRLMTNDEVRMTFQTSADSVPTHEFIAIEKLPNATYSNLTGNRIVDSMQIRLITFAADINLWLHPRNTSLIEENTPVYFAKWSPGKLGNVEFEQQFGAMKRVGQLYEDIEHWASLVIGTDASGKTRVNGHIGSKGLTIRSLPDNIVRNYLRTRRSIDESEYDSSNFSYHVAFNSHENVENENLQTVVNETIASLPETTNQPTPKEIPYQIVPEILVVVENSLYKYWKRQKNNTDYFLEYLVAFWNAVDLKYRYIENPQIRLHISAIIIGSEPEATPYISNHSINAVDFYADSALEDAPQFFYKIKDSFPLNTYDIAVTMTKKQLMLSSGDMILGRTFLNSACDYHDEGVYGTVLIRENGGFIGILSAAHEIGHTFGMMHDNDYTHNVAECSPNYNFIMAAGPHPLSLNSSFFSLCSIDKLRRRLHNHHLQCLYNQPIITDYSLPKILPGNFLNMTEQCTSQGFRGACDSSEHGSLEYCKRLYCYYKPGVCWPSILPVVEGTPCGTLPNMYCLRGRCTKIPELSTEALQNLNSTANWIDRNYNNSSTN